jgi:lysophospholipid acyltransferase (LPLAT)-like uncharacterized protein
MRILLFYFVYFYYVILVKTVRVRLLGFDEVQASWAAKKNVVFCCPHNAILGCCVGVDSQKRPQVVLLSSLSQDGEISSKLLGKRGFEIVRGSSSRGGVKALLELQKAVKLGKSVGITFDGPKGPPLIPKRGIVACASALEAEMFFVHAHCHKSQFLGYPGGFRVGSWDKLLIPFPFGKLTVCFEKIPVSCHQPHVPQEKWSQEDILKFVTQRSFEIYSHLYSKQPK